MQYSYFEMNIITEQEHLERWLNAINQSGVDPCIPDEDRARVEHEINEQYAILYEYLLHVQDVPCF